MIKNENTTKDNLKNTEETNFKIYCAFDNDGESFQNIIEKIVIKNILADNTF